jgi:MFS family permease
MSKEKLWTRDFVTISLINFLVFLSYFLLMVVIASYAVDRFQASAGEAGLVAGIFIIGALVGRLGAGRIIINTGSKAVLIAGTVLFVITSLSYFLAFNLPALVVIRLINGIAFGIASTATGTIVAQIIPISRHGEGIGFYSISAVLGVALGPFVGVLLIPHSDFSLIFIVISLTAFVGLAMSVTIKPPAVYMPEQDRKQTRSGFQFSKFIEYRAIPISMIMLIVGFSYSVVVAFITLYAREARLESAASLYFLTYSAAVLVSRPFSGRLLDSKGTNFVVYPCFFVYALGMFLFSRAGNEAILLLSGALMGLGYGNLISCTQAIAIKSVPPHRLGTATSTYFVLLDLGFGLGPYLLGGLVPYTGYRDLYLLMVGIICAAGALYYILIGRKKRFGRQL